MEVRNERIIMMFESFAIFGALFLGGTWIVYEFGSRNAYGYNIDGGSEPSWVSRWFEFVMAIAIASNIMLAIVASFFWNMAINYSASSEDFVFQMRKGLSMCYTHWWHTIDVMVVGLALAIYQHLSPNWPETILALLLGLMMLIVAHHTLSNAMLSVAPLEVYHAPFWVAAGVTTLEHIIPRRRRNLRSRAKIRAKELKKRAYSERMKLDPNFESSETNESRRSSLELLLFRAAVNLGRADLDVSTYARRLEDDLFAEADELKGRSVEFLSRYMPWRLGEEAHRLLESE
ncbi:hypothetical protein ACHAWF_009715 [Thalassiosira exigua]